MRSVVRPTYGLRRRLRRRRQETIEPVYDKKTGRLTLLKYDSNGNGKIDTWSYMDGARVVRIEIDKDEDGKIDRWEYYGPDQKLEKVGLSRANDGKEDAWSYFNADGIDRADRNVHEARRQDRPRSSTTTRTSLARAEEDSDGDGEIDKWETYDGERLASVAFDTTHRGTPDRRLVYGRRRRRARSKWTSRATDTSSRPGNRRKCQRPA